MFWLSYESFSILSDVFVKKMSFPAENSCIPEKKNKQGGGVKEILF